ncbi:MAG: transposase [Thermomicrobiales bacterium]
MPESYFRPSMRLRRFDYTHPGPYFVTVCLQDRLPRFGAIRDGQLALNDAGHMVEEIWQSLAVRFPSIGLDAFIVMPDHVHGLLLLNNGIEAGGTPHLSEVMQAFKSMTTTRYFEGAKKGIWPRFDKHLWQQNYYDHIIRDERDLDIRRQYIAGNPE